MTAMLINPNRSLELPIGLVADPDMDSRFLYAEWLHARGFDVVQTANGRAAFKLSVLLKPALMIMETWLPLLDGFDLSRQLRRHHRTRAVPIIVVTADARPAALDRSRGAGANVVLTKPVTLEALDEALVTIGLQQEAQRRNNVEASTLMCSVCGGALQDARRIGSNTLFFCQRCGLQFAGGETVGKLRHAG
jgi:CheY-like chemotaxis protein